MSLQVGMSDRKSLILPHRPPLFNNSFTGGLCAQGTQLDALRASLATSASAIIDIACLGDSITQGVGATAYANTWVYKLRNLLRAKYPSGVAGGTSFVSSESSASAFTWPFQHTVGSLSTQSTSSPKRLASQLSSAATFVWTGVGTAVDLVWEAQSGGGIFSYQVDSGSVIQVNTVATTLDGKRTRVSLGATGTHTVTILWVSGNVKFDGLIVYDGDESVGIRVHEAGKPGITAAAWNTATTNSLWPSAVYGGLGTTTLKAIIIDLGINDWGANTDPATLITNLQGVMGSLTTVGFTGQFILIANYPTTGSHTFPWSSYVAAIRSLASVANKISVLDLSNLTITLADGTHPDDAGHTTFANAVYNYLIGA